VVASHHWGLAEDVLDYQVEIAHAAIDAGADVVMATDRTTRARSRCTGASRSSTASAASRSTPGTAGRAHGDWVGMLARLAFDDATLAEVAFSLVRHNERNETYVCDPRHDKDAVEQIVRRCDRLGTTLTISGSQLIVGTAS